MKSTYVVVADAARAQMFALRAHKSATDTQLTKLESVMELHNAARRLRPSERYSDSRPGLQQGSGGGPSHGVDDGRSAQENESERRFARRIMDELQNLNNNEPAERLILAASPRMLGMLRKEAANPGQLPSDVEEIDKALTTLSPVALHDYLAQRALLPERGRA